MSMEKLLNSFVFYIVRNIAEKREGVDQLGSVSMINTELNNYMAFL